jgi:hypothetical protein
MTYEVIVGNIGTVYQGSSVTEAKKLFDEYKQLSIDNYGRAGGESVTLMDKHGIVIHHEGEASK